MTLTKKVNGVRKMKPTPHHKTAYKTKGSRQSWYDRHTKLFTDLAEEIGFEVILLLNGPDEVGLNLKKKGFGDFFLKLEWVRGGMSTVRLYGNCTDETVYPYATWRGHDKPESHNDAHLGNWFLKEIRRDWVEDNRPPIGHIKIGSEIVFSGNPSGGGQRTRAKVVGRGGSWGRKYFRVRLLEQRGVKKIKPIGTLVEVHYDCIFSVKGK